ncbi:heterokaryon incompatibility protein-domain-containing protein [Xylaria palmicola]|nr:heterokaryon incompatibility protein-domain-containing protein [Xylaria palmicola]
MPLSNFSLDFLRVLSHSFSEQEVEDIWHDRTFPLVCTDDFLQAWTVIPDPRGTFLTVLGYRCRVDPQPHHVKHCQVKIRDRYGHVHQRTISYEAIIFAKIAYQLSVQRISRRQGHHQPAIVRHRRFIADFVTKLPHRWRDLIIQCDLHLYDEGNPRLAQTVVMHLYSPLATSRNIRLLEILPSPAPYSPIECILREVGMPPTSDYEALSYVWGKGRPTRSIVLNGRKYPVRENLEAALRQLRVHNNRSRVMWIDALCIDQSNDDERTDQVSHMDAVYRHAKNVEVWLGRESNTSSFLWNHMEQERPIILKGPEHNLSLHHILGFPFEPLSYCRDCDGSRLGDSHVIKSALESPAAIREFEAMKLVSEARMISAQQITNETVRDIEALVKLLERPWWSRVWVLQEVILAKKVTLRCGSRSLDWTHFQAFLFTVIRQGKRSMVRYSHRGGKFPLAMVHALLLNRVTRTLPLFFLQSASFFAQMADRLSMVNLMSLTYEFKATDPRDKIFALVGLLPEQGAERQAFKPDYSTTVKRQFLQVAKYFIEKAGTLEVITARLPIPSSDPDIRATDPHSTMSHRRGELPSWVPNWEWKNLWEHNSIWINSFSPLTTFNLYMQTNHRVKQETIDPSSAITQDTHETNQLFNASLHERSPFAPDFSADNEILGVPGVAVDVIIDVGPPLRLHRDNVQLDEAQAPKRIRDDFMAIIKQWKKVVGLENDESYSFASQQSRREAFWRTLFLDRYCGGRTENGSYVLQRLPDGTDKEKMAQFFARLIGENSAFPPKDDDDEIKFLDYMALEAIEMWSFCNVNVHCLGLSFFVTERGGIGVGHPNMRCGDKVTVLFGSAVPIILREYEEGHMVIGQSYVHGVMDGEMIQHVIGDGTVDEKDFGLFSII